MQLTNSLKNSVLIILKLVAIGFIMLLLMIPEGMINSLVSERAIRRDRAISEVSYKWGNPQSLVGPVLAVPYKKYLKTLKDGKEEKTEEIHYGYFLPEELNIKGNIEPKILNRGIYDVVVYNSMLNFNGSFNRPNFSKWNIAEEDIMWNMATVSIGIPDMRGIKENIKIKWGDKEFEATPGTKMEMILDPSVNMEQNFDENNFFNINAKMPSFGSQDLEISGVNAVIPLESGNPKYQYSFAINLNGSSLLNFSPIANKTSVELSSSWQNPSFNGAFLPDERNIDDKGFSAKWNVLELNRNFPQSWQGKLNNNISTSNFGVKLLIPVDEYQKTDRSIKYAILLIALTFLIFFFVEVINKIKIHPLQYILVGLAILLFFTLLLALSEHINFNIAYLASSLATLIMIFLYSKTVLKTARLSFLTTGILAAIYIFIFTIIQLQDYSLLVGSIGLFIILSSVMYFSRKIDWYSAGAQDLENTNK
ncbi:MAG: cell envelope integrity protein CreD [bacterium]